MRRLAVAFAFATTVFAACSNNTNTTADANRKADSIKALEYTIKAMRDSLKIDSLQKITAQQAQIATQQAQLASLAADRAERSTRRTSSSSYSAPRRTYVKGVSESYYSTTPPAAQKKGWSAAAKGAAIGAGAGALTGVIVDKKDARGGIIGGLVGAGAGYVIGRSQDRKSGRVQ
ncbi:glycine zipper domain-containing protein [Desertivirga brevis]|uniref:glycine zipper domain-containing protein n=1 Tax=Desertivirga brevis TaxID=2810310 RepID=UPI001F6013FC|nr:glycine zipper domain-containing protein [Pedobacter sp. SYSU D00873]